MHLDAGRGSSAVDSSADAAASDDPRDDGADETALDFLCWLLPSTTHRDAWPDVDGLFRLFLAKRLGDAGLAPAPPRELHARSQPWTASGRAVSSSQQRAVVQLASRLAGRRLAVPLVPELVRISGSEGNEVAQLAAPADFALSLDAIPGLATTVALEEGAFLFMLLVYAGGARAYVLEDATEEAARDAWTAEAALTLSEQLPAWARSCAQAFPGAGARRAFALVELARAQTMALATAVLGSQELMTTSQERLHLTRRLRRAWRLLDAAKPDDASPNDGVDAAAAMTCKARQAAHLLGAALRYKTSTQQAVEDAGHDPRFKSACQEIFGDAAVEVQATRLARVLRADARPPSAVGMGPREVGRRSLDIREPLRRALLWAWGTPSEWLAALLRSRRFEIVALHKPLSVESVDDEGVLIISSGQQLRFPSPLAVRDAWAYAHREEGVASVLLRWHVGRVVYDNVGDISFKTVAACKAEALMIAARVRDLAGSNGLANLWAVTEALRDLAAAVLGVDEAINKAVEREPRVESLWILPEWPRDDDDLTGLLEFVQEGRLHAGEEQ